MVSRGIEVFSVAVCCMMQVSGLILVQLQRFGPENRALSVRSHSRITQKETTKNIQIYIEMYSFYLPPPSPYHTVHRLQFRENNLPLTFKFSDVLFLFDFWFDIF
jgi:hypothetical protein